MAPLTGGTTSPRTHLPLAAAPTRAAAWRFRLLPGWAVPFHEQSVAAWEAALRVNLTAPFALVSASDRRDVWSLTASHEMCEMLVDPFGNRLIAGGGIKSGQGRVNYLVEVCDPSEDARFAYTVNGVLVSDFYTPHFFDPGVSGGVRYSFTGAITAPRMIREGGYLTWVDPATGIWWQQTWFDGTGPTFRSLGKMSAKKSLRAQVDRKTAQFTAAAIGSAGVAAVRAASPANAVDSAARNRAKTLRDLIAGLPGVG